MIPLINSKMIVNLPIGKKFIIIIFASLLSVGIIGFSSIHYGHKGLSAMKDVHNDGQMVERISSRLMQPISELYAASISLITTNKKEDIQYIRGQIQVLIHHIDGELEKSKSADLSPQQRSTFNELSLKWKFFRKSILSSSELATSRLLPEAHLRVFKAEKEGFHSLVSILSIWQNDHIFFIQNAYKENVKEARRNRAIIIFILILSASIIIIICYRLSRLIVTPIEMLTSAATKIAAGDLRQNIKVESEDELGVLMETFNLMNAKLRESHFTLEQKVVERTAELVTAKETADSSNRAKSIFLSNMSHEIRTPMNAVLGFSEILRELESDSKKAHYINMINSSGRTLLNLINDILDLSKVESGKMELQYSAVSLISMFEELRSTFSEAMLSKGIDFNIEIEDDVPKSLILDENRMQQVFINIIANSLKFTSSGFVEIVVSSDLTEDSLGSQVDLLFIVSDSGIGIAEDQQRKIFSPFMQADEHQIGDFGGTGLGLSITNQIVKLMGGDVTVRSIVGEGTSFTVRIPKVEICSGVASYDDSYALSHEVIKFSPATILIADDIDFNREMLSAYLHEQDFTFLFAENGKEVLDLVEEHQVDLILLDIKMPIMDGYEVSGILKASEKTKNIPIIAVTASALKHDEEIIKRTCDEYLRKPLKKGDLINKMKHYISYQASTVSDGIAKEECDVTVLPPVEELQKLLHFAKSGDMDGISKYIYHLASIDNEYTPLANKIGTLAASFMDEQILILIEKYIERQTHD